MHASAVHHGGLEQLLGFQLARARVLPDSLFHRHVGAPLDLKPVEFCILALAQANPGIGPARLASALAVSRPQVTQWLDRLEARSLAKRRRSADDRRGFEVHATAAGARLARQAMERLHGAEQAALRALSAAERAMLFELLARLSSDTEDVS